MKKDYKLEKGIIGSLYQMGYIAAVTEGMNGSDILGLRRSLYVVEFEIKKERGDLLREFRDIEKAVNDELYTSKNTKYYKHCLYLGKKTFWHNQSFKPNEFYFLVSEDFLSLAEQKLKELPVPYGLMGYNQRDWCTILYSIKRSKRLHGNKINNGEMLDFLRRASYESQSLRERIISNEKQT